MLHHLFLLSETEVQSKYLFYTQVVTLLTLLLTRLFSWTSQRVIAKKVENVDRKVDENTEISRKAFTEANNFNGKIQAIRDMLDNLSKTHGHETSAQTQEKIDEMSRTTTAMRGEKKS